jgi:hypothetical protein
MRFPAGQSKLHKGVHPQEVLGSVDTGYVRLTVEESGLNDHYVLYLNKEIIGALCEFSDGRHLYGAEAVEYILSLDVTVLAQTVVYTEDVLNTTRKENPAIFLAPGIIEKFKVGDTMFTGTLCAVKTGDLLPVISQLEKDALIGCLRITRESDEAVQEGAVLLLEKPVAAVFESEDSIRLGDEALREIALAYTQGRIYELKREFIENFLLLNNASRLKFPVEETIASEKARDDLKRFMVLQMLGLDRGTLVLNAPCNGTFSFEALLKSAASRHFDGYLWIRSEHARGLMVLGQGRVQAAYTTEPSGESMGAAALKQIYDSMETKGTVDFYQLPSPPRITQSFEGEEGTDNQLVKRLMGEMGEELIKDVSVAKEFKKRWKDKRKKLGE